MPFKTSADVVRLGHPLRFAVVALAVCVVIGFVVPAAAGTWRGSAATGRAGVPQINWVPCGPQLECANVPVPLDWAHPNGPTIALAVSRRLASHPGQRIGSLFVNPGGPGDSGVAAPLANAKLAERRLGNAVLLIHDGYGHISDADPSACVMQALGRYFTGLTTP